MSGLRNRTGPAKGETNLINSGMSADLSELFVTVNYMAQ